MGNETFAHFLHFTIKVILVHLVTYLVFGLVMSNLLNYEELFQQEVIRDFMHPLGSRSLLGVLFQPVRGLLFAVAVWPIRSAILETRHGWLRLWSIFMVFAILSTASAAPSSIEGMLYSKLPLGYHLIGLPEIALQTLAFSYLLVWWDRRQSIPTGVPRGKRQGFLSELLMAVVVGCFAYIGYALGSLAVFFLSGSDLSFDAAAGDVRTHLMFVVAFVCNVVYVLFVSRKWLRNEISFWVVGALAWALDGLVLFFYQWLVFGGSSLTVTMLIGLLPAGIIALSIRQNYKRLRVS
ncbi:MAG TPA: hypothetical protein VFI11_09215 [Anaerolineales bacterium]|nr:hypothetical protein [Anaerolineales bacterium]